MSTKAVLVNHQDLVAWNIHCNKLGPAANDQHHKLASTKLHCDHDRDKQMGWHRCVACRARLN